ncbi:MAG TPA: hypothetical protein VJN18_25300 [Polyangiaceae bacterium]|nr:hypothetical protein [Polyangiaceae bacterium]
MALVEQNPQRLDPRFKKTLPAAPAELIKYVMVELDVPREFHIPFQEQMQPLVEIMFDLKKWELVFAAYPITGQVNRFVHIWQIPDESSIVEVMREGALGSELPAANHELTLQEEFRACYQAVQGMIANTRHTLMTSLPYDPAHVGYQSQTILVDVDAELFLIEHSELKQLSQLDISGELEVVRKGRTKLRSTGQRGSRTAAAGELKQKERVDEYKTIQSHLNRGSSVATVTLGGNKSLLFNLAALKSKSVYQSVQANEVDEKAGNTLKLAAGNKLDLPGGLLIAAPWGCVYTLDEKTLRRIAVGIVKGGRTKAAVQPLIESKVPLAAIPEERDQVIGDGCACYVINLHSFVAWAAEAPGADRAAE